MGNNAPPKDESQKLAAEVRPLVERLHADLNSLSYYQFLGVGRDASPQAIQRSITLPIEEAARTLKGVENVESMSRSGRSQVEIEFRRGTNMEFAQLELNEQLGSVRRDLPMGAQQPQVETYVPEEFETEPFFAFLPGLPRLGCKKRLTKQRLYGIITVYIHSTSQNPVGARPSGRKMPLSIARWGGLLHRTKTG